MEIAPILPMDFPNACLELVKLNVASASSILRLRLPEAVPKNTSEHSVLYCILRYSNQSFLSISDDFVKVWGPKFDNMYIHSTFNDEIIALIQNVSTSPSRIGSSITSASNSQKIYALPQCTSDIDENLCYSCLQSMLLFFETTGFGNIYENIYSLSCNMRYETHHFYNVSESPSRIVAAAPTPTSDNAAKILL